MFNVFLYSVVHVHFIHPFSIYDAADTKVKDTDWRKMCIGFENMPYDEHSPNVYDLTFSHGLMIKKGNKNCNNF